MSAREFRTESTKLPEIALYDVGSYCHAKREKLTVEMGFIHTNERPFVTSPPKIVLIISFVYHFLNVKLNSQLKNDSVLGR